MVSSKGVTRLMRRRIAAGATGNEAAATRRSMAGLIVIQIVEEHAEIRRLRHAARDEEAEDRRLRKPRGKHPPRSVRNSVYRVAGPGTLLIALSPGWA